jgi:hypothetical protein
MTLGRLLRFRYRQRDVPAAKTLTVDQDGPGLTIRLADAPREPQDEPARVLPMDRRSEPE